MEPIAASYAIEKANLIGNGIIIGNNRIAELTRLIAKTMGLSMKESEKYDWMIETQMTQENLDFMISRIQDGGKIVLKSRSQNILNFISNDLIKKDITLQAVSYANFDKSMRWLENNHNDIAYLLGNTYHIDDFQEAFNEANSTESKKIFIKVGDICVDLLQAN